MRSVLSIILTTVLFSLSGIAYADCKDDIRDLREEINDDRGEYTVAALAEAKKHLLQAEVAVAQPVKCRQNLVQARKTLRQGAK